MTIEEVIAASLGRTAEFGVGYPASESSLIRRVSQRQMELFAVANQINPDYFGVCATAGVPYGAADLREMRPPVFGADSISRVEIKDPGTSAYLLGQEVHVVSYDDVNSAFPPRVTIRDLIVKQVGTDLAGVGALEVYYPRSPLPIPLDNPAYVIDLPQQFQELLVLDLAREIFRRALHLGDTRADLIGLMSEEEAPLMENFLGHVRRYTGSQIQRFATRTTQAAP